MEPSPSLGLGPLELHRGVEEGAEPRGQHPAQTVHVHVHVGVAVCSAFKSRSVEELRWFQQVLVGRFLVWTSGPRRTVCLTVPLSVCLTACLSVSSRGSWL